MLAREFELTLHVRVAERSRITRELHGTGFIGLEIALRRILHELQHASEQIAMSSGLSDVDDSAAGEVAGEDVTHPFVRVLVKVVQHLIDQEPGRRVNDSPGK